MNRLTITLITGAVRIFETEESFDDFDGLDLDSNYFSVNETALFNPEHVVSLEFEALPAAASGSASSPQIREVLGGFPHK